MEKLLRKGLMRALVLVMAAGVITGNMYGMEKRSSSRGRSEEGSHTRFPLAESIANYSGGVKQFARFLNTINQRDFNAEMSLVSEQNEQLRQAVVAKFQWAEIAGEKLSPAAQKELARIKGRRDGIEESSRRSSGSEEDDSESRFTSRPSSLRSDGDERTHVPLRAAAVSAVRADQVLLEKYNLSGITDDNVDVFKDELKGLNGKIVGDSQLADFKGIKGFNEINKKGSVLSKLVNAMYTGKAARVSARASSIGDELESSPTKKASQVGLAAVDTTGVKIIAKVQMNAGEAKQVVDLATADFINLTQPACISINAWITVNGEGLTKNQAVVLLAKIAQVKNETVKGLFTAGTFGILEGK